MRTRVTWLAAFLLVAAASASHAQQATRCLRAWAIGGSNTPGHAHIQLYNPGPGFVEVETIIVSTPPGGAAIGRGVSWSPLPQRLGPGINSRIVLNDNCTGEIRLHVGTEVSLGQMANLTVAGAEVLPFSVILDPGESVIVRAGDAGMLLRASFQWREY